MSVKGWLLENSNQFYWTMMAMTTWFMILEITINVISANDLQNADKCGLSFSVHFAFIFFPIAIMMVMWASHLFISTSSRTLAIKRQEMNSYCTCMGIFTYMMYTIAMTLFNVVSNCGTKIWDHVSCLLIILNGTCISLHLISIMAKYTLKFDNNWFDFSTHQAVSII